MLWPLLQKDLRRNWRSPWGWMLNLALPICITALIGLVFGGSNSGSGLGQIKLAIVDEDDSPLSGFIRSATSQSEFKKHIEARFLERTEALAQIEADEISAVLIIPSGFAANYLSGEESVALELIKNPAQTIYPAIVEELLGVLASGLNAVARNLQADFPEWRAVLEKEGSPNMQRIADLIVRVGNRFEKAEKYLFPPLVQYGKKTEAEEKSARNDFNIFGYLLPGLAAMFFLFMADTAIRDLYREVTGRTFDRYRTLNHQIFPFIFSKILLAVTLLGLGGVVLFVGGALVFGVQWKQPLALGAAILGFALFASGFMALLAALARSSARADAFNGMIILSLSFCGGSFFPANQLPALFRDHISPVLPNYWFIEGVRELQFSGEAAECVWIAIQLAALGLVLAAAASWLLHRFLSKGIRA